jgi:hypothetical protein
MYKTNEGIRKCTHTKTILLTIVPSDKRVPVPVRDSAVYVFLRLLHCYIHVAIKTRQNPWYIILRSDCTKVRY